jgi:hypothetical protein
MTEKCENQKPVVHEVERAELAQIDGGWDSGEAPDCGSDWLRDGSGWRHEALLRAIRNSPSPHPPPWGPSK